MRRGRSASRSMMSPTCRAGRISRCRNWISAMADSPISRPISRLGGAPEQPDDPMLAEMFDRIRASRGHVLNIHRVVGHAPNMLRAQAAYTRALREESSLPRDLQELLILRIAQVNDSTYEQSVHV